jgi:hypothetical protein
MILITRQLINQDWYFRRGYEIVLFKKDGYVEITADNRRFAADLVFMVKSLA